MSSHRIRHFVSGLISIGTTVGLVAATPQFARAVIVVNDSWADGGRDDGADPLDSNWWTSSSSSGIEVAVGSLGMVTGTSGRGIHTIFPTQSLANVGHKLVATYTFQTPATVGTGSMGGFRVGLFDTLGRAGLNADISASSGTPNAIYGWGTGAAGPGTAGLPGYMLDMDVGTGSEDLTFRAHDAGTVNPTGRLMAVTTGFTQISPTGPDGVYTFAPNSTYSGSLTLERLSTTEMQITGTLGAASHSVTDLFDSANVGMLAFLGEFKSVRFVRDARRIKQRDRLHKRDDRIYPGTRAGGVCDVVAVRLCFVTEVAVAAALTYSA